MLHLSHIYFDMDSCVAKPVEIVQYAMIATTRSELSFFFSSELSFFLGRNLKYFK